MKKYLRYLWPVLITGIFVLAVYLLYNKLKVYSIAQIRESVEQISHGCIAFSLFLMVINYLILVGYDWLALKAIHKSLPLPRVGLVSFVGQAVSYNFGALLGGTTVRYRFYSAWGFSLADIVRLVLMLAVTFWVGALGLCGLIFMIAPPAMPDELMARMPAIDVHVLGAILFAIACSYLVLCFVIRKPVHIFGKEFVFPPPHIALAQFVVAGVDIVAAAACMYVLLPAELNLSFMEFLPGYLMAQVAVVLTHIPGGVGVFELVIIHLTHTPQEQVVFAAVLLFRLIYYIVPLLAAAVLLAAYEARQSRHMLRDTGRWLSTLSHTIAAYAAFIAGLCLLAATVWPARDTSVAMVNAYLPYGVSAVAHFACALSGAALLFVSYGLERRQNCAFKMAVGLLVLGFVAALLKDMAWVTGIIVALALMAVCMAKKRFYRSSFFWEEPIPAYWLVGALGVLCLVFFAGWALYHPAWDHAAEWGFDHPLNAGRALRAFIGIVAGLGLSWAWRVHLRRKSARR